MIPEPLVLLPGSICDSRVFTHQLAVLGRDRAVQVAPLTSSDRITELADHVLATAPDHFALAGHELGGMVALEILRRQPARVMRIALMSSSAQAEGPSLAALREEKIVRANAGRLEDVLGEKAIDGLSDGKEATRKLLVSMGLGLGTQAFQTQSRALQRRPDQQRTLRQLKVPMLLLCGEKDPFMPVRQHEFVTTLAPKAKLKVLDGVSHYPTLEAPAETTKALAEWLQEPFLLV